MKVALFLLGITFLGFTFAADPVATFHHFDDVIGGMKYIDHKNVLILSSGHLFRSVNGGKDWQKVDLPLLPGPGASTSAINIHVSVKGHVFLQGNKDSIFISKDAGKTWKGVRTAGHLETIEWHPRESGWALGTLTKDSHATYEAHITNDYGETWKKVADNIIMSEAYWGDCGVGEVPDARIYFVEERTAGDLTHFHLVYSDDFGATKTVINKQTIAVVFRPHQIFVLSYSDDYSEVYLRVSPDVGVKKDKVFMRAEFPWGEELENSLYSIEDDTYQNVWMGINHGHRHANWGHLYHSDVNGVQYSLSVPYIYFSWPLFDFHRIKGMDGVYVVNTIENPEDDWDHRLQTWITHDQGRNWEALNPPPNHGFHCESGQHCALHLHGWNGYYTGYFGPFYSTETALGIVIGTGNVGEHLTQDGQVATFLSHDGGNNFIKVLDFASIYEISNHGGIIVFAQLGVLTKTIYYTTDYGQTKLKSITLSEEVDVRNIVAEDRLTGAQFILEDYNGHSVVHLDFEPYLGKACAKADYENWSPVNPNTQYHEGKECLMGRALVYHRRKPNNVCLIPDNFDQTRVMKKTYCSCTDWDYICDFGWYHSHDDPETGAKYCHRDATVQIHDPPLWCVPGRKYYTSTNGLVKEPGNECQGGVQYPVQEHDCPSHRLEDDESGGGSSSHAGWIAVGVILPMIAVVLAGAYFAMNSEKFRERFPALEGLFNRFEGYSQMGQPGNAPGALFDDEEYIIGPLDDKNDEEEESGELKTVDLHSVHSEALNADLEEFDPRK